MLNLLALPLTHVFYFFNKYIYTHAHNNYLIVILIEYIRF